MLTPPELEDPRQYDYEYGDQEEMIYKKNALNAYHYNFYNALKVIVGELNVEFQFVADSRLDITNKSGQVATALQQVNTAKQSVDQSKNHIDQQKEAIDSTAGQVSDHAQEVADNRQLVADDKQAAADSAHAAGESAGQAEQSKQAAQDLYQDLDAVNTAKMQSQQAAQTATDQAGLAESSAATATEQAGIATEAAQQANADIDAAINANNAEFGIGEPIVITPNLLAEVIEQGDYWIATNDPADKPVSRFCHMSVRNYAGSIVQTVIARDLPGERYVNVSDDGGATWSGFKKEFNSANQLALGTTASEGRSALGLGSAATQPDSRYPKLETFNVFSGDLEISKDNPWLTLDSPAGGEIGVEQCAGISIGESGKKGAAALHLTYTGDGRGHIGMGVVDVATGIPENEVMELYYQSKDVKFLGGLTLPDGVRLDGITNGLKVTNNANGYVEIGNRNSGHTHYTSSNGSHYFYGVLRVAEGFQGDGSGVTNVNATKLGGKSLSEYDDANTVAGRTSAGDLRARLFRSTYTPTNSNIAVIYTAAKSDGTDFMRPSTPAQVRTALDVDVPTGSNSNGRYYLYPDGRLVMHCGPKTFSQDPASNRRLLASVTLPYTPLGSAEHYVTVNPSSDAGDYTNASSPFDVSGVLVKPGRLSSGTVVEIRLLAQEGRTFSTSATTVAPVLIESRWK
ncbi:hypothetical protein SAMN04487867_104164 [Vreelandella titanicae]|uniref:hypothetical protein n=1 Tax=Vreelandella titanicae TaxID=664683 RepID=UPI0008839A9B|nr:hypothetical protein [Halomonas titanicae]SDI29942.1 hypothetical protein SAMN04487867_104164 [Halomonas titanicae]